MLRLFRMFSVKKWFFLVQLVVFHQGTLLYGSTFFDTGDPRVMGLDFDRRYSYVPNSVELKEEEGNFFLTQPTVKVISFPERNPIGEVEMPSYASSTEIALKRLIPGKDGRHPVHYPEQDEFYRVHAQMMMLFSGREYGGSGTLVGPNHLLTAGHNLYDREQKAWASQIRVRLALNDNYLPFGVQHVVRAYTYKQWVKGSEDEAQLFDLALFVLDKPIGTRIGWHGLCYLNRYAPALKGEIYIAGYPGEVMNTFYPEHETKNIGPFKKMWWMSNKDKDQKIVPIEVSQEQLYYQIDTSGGQSGSSIVWLKGKSKAYVIGIHAYGEKEDGRGNYGTRLTKEKLLDIQQWISATYEVSGRGDTLTSQTQAPIEAQQQATRSGLRIGGNIHQVVSHRGQAAIANGDAVQIIGLVPQNIVTQALAAQPHAQGTGIEIVKDVGQQGGDDAQVEVAEGRVVQIRQDPSQSST